jgi:hypothetical protein
MSSKPDANLRIARVLLRPLVKHCLNRGVLLQQIVNILKLVLIEVAEEKLAETTNKINTSRISVMTGVHRTDVANVFKHRQTLHLEEPITVVGRVIAEWSNNPRYSGKSGKPRILDLDSEQNEFFELVSSLTTGINPATVLFELIRNGAAKKTPRGLKLIRQTRTLAAHEEKAYEFLARDIEYMTRSLEENLAVTDGDAGNLQHRTDYDNIYIKDIPKIRKWLLTQGRRFHKEAREFLSQFDKDLSTTAKPHDLAGGAVHLSTFSLIEQAREEVDLSSE